MEDLEERVRALIDKLSGNLRRTVLIALVLLAALTSIKTIGA